MKLISCLAALGAAALLGPALLQGAAAEDTATAKAPLKDAKGQDVGVASFTQTLASVLVRLSVRSMPSGEHAFHIHAVGKCDPPDFASAGAHFNPTNTHHGMMSGPQSSRYTRQRQTQLGFSSGRHRGRDPRRQG